MVTRGQKRRLKEEKENQFKRRRFAALERYAQNPLLGLLGTLSEAQIEHLSAQEQHSLVYLIASFIHRVPESSVFIRKFLGLPGQVPVTDVLSNPTTYFEAHDADGGSSNPVVNALNAVAMAKAVTHRTLSYGRGNVAADIQESTGSSYASLIETRHGYETPDRQVKAIYQELIVLLQRHHPVGDQQVNELQRVVQGNFSLAEKLAQLIICVDNSDLYQQLEFSEKENRLNIEERSDLNTLREIRLQAQDATVMLQLTPVELSALKAMRAGGGNCGEHADVAYTFLNTQVLPAGTLMFRCSNKRDDHAFVMLAVPCATTVSGCEVLVCDPWMDIARTYQDARLRSAELFNGHDLFESGHRLVLERYKNTSASDSSYDRAGELLATVKQPECKHNIFLLPDPISGKIQDTFSAAHYSSEGLTRLADPAARGFYQLVPYPRGEEAKIPDSRLSSAFTLMPKRG